MTSKSEAGFFAAGSPQNGHASPLANNNSLHLRHLIFIKSNRPLLHASKKPACALMRAAGWLPNHPE